MNRTAIAVALAGLVAAPALAVAKPDIYGSVRISENYTKTSFNDNPITGRSPAATASRVHAPAVLQSSK